MMTAQLLAGTTLLGLVLSGCGGSSPGGAGGAGSVVLPPPPAAPAPPPAQPASALDFDTAEVGRSNGATQARAVAAWQEGASGAGVVVAVIDLGVTPSLPAFSGRISSQSRDIAGNRGLADDDGHGTSVSGVLVAGRDGDGIVGVAWGATLLALRVDNPGSCATSDGCRYSSNAIAQGYDIATQAGARVVNLSLGGSALAPTVAAAAQRAGAAGVVTVVAAGNDASSEITPFAAGLVEAAPATTLVVGALDGGGAMASFSNRAGAAANNYLTALGVRVRSFDETGAAKLYSGTSEAAPIVSGAVALLADAFPALSGSEIARILLQTADDLGAPGTDPVFGRGQLNIERAFQPIGGLSVEGVAAPVAVAGGSLGPAMGDIGLVGAALRRVEGQDDFGRRFTTDLAAQLRPAAAGRLAGALFTASGEIAEASAGPVSLRFVAADNGRRDWHGDRLTGAAPANLTPAPAQGHLRMDLGQGRRAVLGFGQSADALVTLAQDRALRPDMLLAGQGGLMMQPGQGAAFGQRIGTLSATLALGEARLAANRLDGEARMHSALFRLAHDGGPVTLAATLRLEVERGSLLGARLSPVYGVSGASHIGLGFEASWQRGALALAGGAELRRVSADVRGGALLAGLADMGASSAWASASWRGAQDMLSLSLAQPLRAFGQADVRLGGAAQRLALTPTGRELVAELGWSRALAGGQLGLHGFARRQPGHIAGAPADVGAAVTFRLRH
ncbi:MAG: S8 family peptidase [Polymorphobacter sp.]|uniref:S8 family peptidase n=1 Tax=Polymorphobacter sp. TaxID=1909290 RepID=UPI003A85FF5F